MSLVQTQRQNQKIYIYPLRQSLTQNASGMATEDLFKYYFDEVLFSFRIALSLYLNYLIPNALLKK